MVTVNVIAEYREAEKNLLVPDELSTQATAVHLQRLFEQASGNEWMVECNEDTGEMIFYPSPERLGERGMQVKDWHAIIKYIGITKIPYTAMRYKIFTDEVKRAIKNLEKHNK